MREQTNQPIQVPIAPSAAGTTSSTRYCSFCFKSQFEVKTLVAGPASIFVCDECVEACNHVVAGDYKAQSQLLDQHIPTERLLQRLQAIEETLQGRSNQLQHVVELLRKRAVSWALIGQFLGMSRQAAWERFT